MTLRGISRLGVATDRSDSLQILTEIELRTPAE
jgi:hypothetical protein